MDSCARVVVRAPAKVNLYLDIVGRMENGYHALSTIMHTVSLCDLLVLRLTPEPGIRVRCSRPGIPEDAGNLAYKAAALFFEQCGCTNTAAAGLLIYIDKLIPHEAGLGGGSADAAAVLVGLNRIFDAGLSPAALCELGLRLGADVPFALTGGCALCEGVGERITPLPLVRDSNFFLIAKPSVGMSTREAYARYDARAVIGSLRHGNASSLRAALEHGSFSGREALLFNVFEQLESGGITQRIKSAMTASGALGCALSGSGSAVCGVFSSRTQAEDCAAGLPELAGTCFVCSPEARGAFVLAVG